MTTNQALYTALRISRAVTAVRKGRALSYAKRSLFYTLLGKIAGKVAPR